MSSLTSLTSLSSQVSSLVSAFINEELICILKDISKRYEIDEQELMHMYKHKLHVTNTITSHACIAAQCSTNCPDHHTSEQSSASEKKRRGRKKKQKDEFIETEEYDYDGNKYLVDSNNNVYTFNIEEPHLIGERFVDGTIRFFTIDT